MKILRYLLIPFSFLYRFLFFLDQRFTTRKKISNAKVISIGNLSMGGSGKTPFTMYLLDLLYKKNVTDLVLLSRGYGGRASSSGGMSVTIDSDPLESGDEPLMIKRNLPQVEVIVGKNRYNSFNTFYSKKGNQPIVVLDDGFQHHALERNFDFVLIDAENLLGNGWTIPVGNLRETESALKRANAVVFTKVNDGNLSSVQSKKNSLESKFPHLSFFELYYRPVRLENCKKHSVSIQSIVNQKVFAFSAIGNPESFISVLNTFSPGRLESKHFLDHYFFELKDLDNLLSRTDEFSYFICTEKDFIKFGERIKNHSKYEKIYYLKMEVEISPSKLFNDLVNKIIRG